MKAKKKQLLVFLIVLILLGGAAAVLLLLPNGGEEEVSSTTYESTLSLWSYETEEVSGIAVENASGSYFVEPDGEGGFQIAELAAYPRYNTQYTYLVSTLTGLSAQQVVEEAAADIAKYGLSAPQATAQLTLTDGTVKTVYLGDLTADGTTYYGKTGDSDAVYLFDSYTAGYLMQNRYVYISRALTKGTETTTTEDGETETISPTLTYLQISRPDLSEPIIIKPRDDEAVSAGLTVSGYGLTSPVVIDVGYDQKSVYLDEAIGMAGSAIAGIASTPEERAAYGIDNPTLQLVVELDGVRTRMTFGSRTETGGYYMMTETTDLVYEMDQSMVPWMTVTPEELMSSTILNPMITSVDRLTVTVDGTEYQFSLIGEEDTAAKDLQIRYNGQQIVTSNFQDFYMVLISLEAVELNRAEVTGSPEVTIQYHYKDESRSADEISLVPMTDRRYSIRVNGRDDFIAYATTVQKIKSDLQTLISGGEINTNY